MKKYIQFFTIVTPINEPNKFHENLRSCVDKLQIDNLEVEIQYQQSDIGMSALVLGYKNE